MADSNLPSTPADGNILTLLVPTVADLSAPTLDEINAATAVDISCYLTPGGFAFTIDQATITDERECDTITRNEPGRVTPSLAVTGIDNTNSPHEDEYNKLVEALVNGQEIVALRRRGLPHTTAVTAAEKVATTRFKPGIRQEVPSEANSTTRSTWTCFVSGHVPDAVVAAGTGG